MSFDERAAAAGAGLIALILYTGTLYPSVPGGDSGELIVAAHTLGSAHPPGYPLYVLLAKAFTSLPFNSVAWRANLVSAVCNAGAVSLLALTVGRLTGNPWGGLAAGGLFAFSSTVWAYATAAEVFALNNLLVALQLYLAVRAWSSRDVRFVYATAFAAALGASNHLTSGFTSAVVLGAVLWATRDRWRTASRLAMLACAVAAGLLPYAWLPVASASATPSPAQWGDQTTIGGFIDHVLRKDYGTLRLASPLYERRIATLAQLGYYGRDALGQLAWIGVPLAAFGLYRGLRDDVLRGPVATSVVAWGLFLLIFHSLANLPLDQPFFHGVVARFWQQPHLLVCAWAGMGLTYIAEARRLIAPAAIALVAVQIAMNARTADHHRDWTIHDYGLSLLRPLPHQTLVLTLGDIVLNSARYLQTAEHVRPDVRILDQEMLTYRWMKPLAKRLMPDITIPAAYYDIRAPGTYTLKQLVDANIEQRPVVICGGVKAGDTSLDGTYDQWPLGICSQLVPKAKPLDVGEWLRRSEAALPEFRMGTPEETAADSWERIAWNDYWEAHHRRGVWLLTVAIARGGAAAHLEQAATIFDDLIQRHPSPPLQYFKNVGIAYARLSPARPDAAPRAIEAWRTYLKNAPPTDRDLPAISQAIVELERTIR